jgi:predicted Fe-S protein YdhL (DUF1289 family)
MPDKTKKITSPCVRNCCLDEQDICIGCARHLDEIIGWQNKSHEQKEAVLVNCQKRIAAKKI